MGAGRKQPRAGSSTPERRQASPARHPSPSPRIYLRRAGGQPCVRPSKVSHRPCTCKERKKALESLTPVQLGLCELGKCDAKQSRGSRRERSLCLAGESCSGQLNL